MIDEERAAGTISPPRKRWSWRSRLVVVVRSPPLLMTRRPWRDDSPAADRRSSRRDVAAAGLPAPAPRRWRWRSPHVAESLRSTPSRASSSSRAAVPPSSPRHDVRRGTRDGAPLKQYEIRHSCSVTSAPSPARARGRGARARDASGRPVSSSAKSAPVVARASSWAASWAFGQPTLLADVDLRSLFEADLVVDETKVIRRRPARALPRPRRLPRRPARRAASRLRAVHRRDPAGICRSRRSASRGRVGGDRLLAGGRPRAPR